MCRFLLALLSVLLLSPVHAEDGLTSAPAEPVTETTGTHWMCRYVYGPVSSFIECADGQFDEALTDEQPSVKRLEMYTLPMSLEDIEFAEQLIDAVLCFNVPDCTAVLSHPLQG